MKTALLALLAASTTAADLLPLSRGVYVREGYACKGAPNAATSSYWGGDNGINSQQESCTIKRMRRKGDSYSLGRICVASRFGETFEDVLDLQILNNRRFSASGNVYRYCGARVQS